MSTTNNGRPFPWHDTPTCDEPHAKWVDGARVIDGVCGGPMVPVEKMDNGYSGDGSRIACVACGTGRVGTAAEARQAERASRAWELYEDGLVHQDRGCTRCNGPLMLDRFRLCASCVEKDVAERQASLF